MSDRQDQDRLDADRRLELWKNNGRFWPGSHEATRPGGPAPTKRQVSIVPEHPDLTEAQIAELQAQIMAAPQRPAITPMSVSWSIAPLGAMCAEIPVGPIMVFTQATGGLGSPDDPGLSVPTDPSPHAPIARRFQWLDDDTGRIYGEGVAFPGGPVVVRWGDPTAPASWSLGVYPTVAAAEADGEGRTGAAILIWVDR